MTKETFWYGEWQSCIENYDVVIIDNDIRGRGVIEYIQSRNPNVRIIVYFESTLANNDRKNPRAYRGIEHLKFFTFDKNDSV